MALRARAYLEADNMASAIKDYSKAIELNPISAYYAGRGFAYAAGGGQFDEALNDLARAIELDPRSRHGLCLPRLDLPTSAAGGIGPERG